MSKATQKSELGEDELLQELAYLDQAEYIDKQAYPASQDYGTAFCRAIRRGGWLLG